MDNPLVNQEYVKRRWGDKVPPGTKWAFVHDLRLLDSIQKNEGITLNCQFYKVGKITHGSTFHHYSPEWDLELKDSKDILHYSMGDFYLIKDKVWKKLPRDSSGESPI